MKKESIFDILTDKYDAWYDSEDGRPLYESELRCLKSMVEDAPKPILEIGVGTGRFAMHFPDVVGIDPSLNALKMAKKRGVKTVHGYGENLPFEDETFGCILIIVTLCFVENPLDVLREAKRVLKKNGSIIIGLVPKDSPWGIFYEEKKKAGHPFYSSARFYTLEDVKELLQKVSLKISRIRSTLLQRPDEPRKIEEPVEGYERDAGFLCIEARHNIYKDMPMDTVIAEGLKKNYNSFAALDGVSFSIKKGEVFGLLGPNGAGKTTTIRILSGLLKPTSGSALIMGNDVIRKPIEVKKSIGVVPETSNLYPELTCFENLLFAGRLYGMRSEKVKSRADELLSMFGLEEKKDVLFSKLSSGMKRRLTMAASLIHEPPVLFLDEPTTGLDVMSARALRETIQSLKQKGISILLTTHYIEEADRLCDRIAIIVKGRIVVIDAPEALKKSVSDVNPSLEDAFVEITGLKSELMFQEKEGGR